MWLLRKELCGSLRSHLTDWEGEAREEKAISVRRKS